WTASGRRKTSAVSSCDRGGLDRDGTGDGRWAAVRPEETYYSGPMDYFCSTWGHELVAVLAVGLGLIGIFVPAKERPIVRMIIGVVIGLLAVGLEACCSVAWPMEIHHVRLYPSLVLRLEKGGDAGA